MTTVPHRPALVTTGTTTLVRAAAADIERRGPHKFADPAAWLVRSVLAAAEPPGAALPAGLVGVIGVSDVATAHTLRAVAADAACGRSSPRRFVAASPGTLVGLSCIEFGHVGPSLLLTMPEEPGRALALVLAESWLLGDPPAAARVAIVWYGVDASGAHRATCRWVAAATVRAAAPAARAAVDGPGRR